METALKKHYRRLGLIFLLTVLLIWSYPLLAQDMESKITSTGEKVKSILNAAVGVLGLVGAFYIFWQYKQGNPEAKANLIKLCIGLFIWYSASAIISALK